MTGARTPAFPPARALTRIPALTLAATLALLPLQAAAQSTLERLETVSTTMNAMMNDAFVAEIPALAGNMPDPGWDAPMRTAYTCMHDAYVARAGEAAVADMLSQMEASLDTLSAEDLRQGNIAVDNPEGITDDAAAQIVTDCGLIEVFMTRMAASGAMGIMMQQQ